MMKRPTSLPILRLGCAGLLLLLAGCGMKGPLRHPAPPPPADATLTAPPTVTPTPAPQVQP